MIIKLYLEWNIIYHEIKKPVFCPHTKSTILADSDLRLHDLVYNLPSNLMNRPNNFMQFHCKHIYPTDCSRTALAKREKKLTKVQNKSISIALQEFIQIIYIYISNQINT